MSVSATEVRAPCPSPWATAHPQTVDSGANRHAARLISYNAPGETHLGCAFQRLHQIDTVRFKLLPAEQALHQGFRFSCGEFASGGIHSCYSALRDHWSVKSWRRPLPQGNEDPRWSRCRLGNGLHSLIKSAEHLLRDQTLVWRDLPSSAAVDRYQRRLRVVCPGTGGQAVKSYCSHFAAQTPSD